MPLSYKSLSGSTAGTQYVTAASSATMYSATIALVPGIYTITCISSTVAYVEFWNGATYIGKATTYLGSTSYNLATAATKVYYYTSTGSSVSIGIALTGTNVSGSLSGTLYTITANQTFTETGVGYAIVIGGGGGGGGGANSSSYNSTGGGGGSGGLIDAGYITLTGSLAVVIGAAGTGGINGGGGTSGTAGTLSSVSGNSAGGGGGGEGGSGYNSGPGGSAGSPNGGAGGSGMYSFAYAQNSPSNGSVSTIGISTMPMIVAAPGTVGGGGGGGGGGSAGSMTYGKGGNGGGYGGAGSNGGSGIVYILKLT